MRFALALACTLSVTAPAAAQPGPPSERVTARAVPLGDGVVRVVSRWGMDSGSARLTVPHGHAVELYDGMGAATLVAGHDAVLVAYGVDEARTPFRYRLVRREGDTVRVGDAVEMHRPGSRRDLPFAVVATPTEDGFSIFYQEIQEDDPSAAHTYLLHVGADGRPAGQAQEVRVPWSLAAAVDNGHGFHLALIYPGDARGMRLSMVSFSPAGQPQQHPDWSSRPGMIDDVHLVRNGGTIKVFYRGGDGGDRLLERDVTRIGSWGHNPPAARDHGRLRQSQAILIRMRHDVAVAERVPVRAD